MMLDKIDRPAAQALAPATPRPPEPHPAAEFPVSIRIEIRRGGARTLRALRQWLEMCAGPGQFAMHPEGMAPRLRLCICFEDPGHLAKMLAVYGKELRVVPRAQLRPATRRSPRAAATTVSTLAEAPRLAPLAEARQRQHG